MEMEPDVLVALDHIEADDRMDWIRVGCALKTAYGEEGFAVWDAWSKTSAKYQPRVMDSQWKSLKEEKVQLGTIFHLARQNGYAPEGREPDPQWRQKRRDREREANARGEVAKAKRKKDQAEALKKAHYIIKTAEYRDHPYFDRKGFPEHQSLVYKNLVVLPIRSWKGDVLGVQLIDFQGNKTFLKDSLIERGRFYIGRGRERWIVEGYATGLTLAQALRRMARPSEICVAFSVFNAMLLARETEPDRLIVDNDKSGTGAKYARASGCRWWMPPEIGDANDFMLKYGIEAVVKELQAFIRKEGE